MNKTKLILLILATTLLITACQPDESGKLENRVKAYWQHKINKEFDKAYEFTTPGYKKLNTKQSYELLKSNNSLEWVAFTINDKKCSQDDLCKVTMSVRYKFKIQAGGHMASKDMEVNTPIKETWMLKDNVWYVVEAK